jgi:cobalt/nickel transport system permease protein
MASVLTVQAFFFADGGLLALGCNIFNLGFFPAFVAYPLVYQPLARSVQGWGRPWAGAVLAAIVGLQLGAFAVVLETTFSGMVDLPFRKFVLLMQPIHFAIGLVEGVATAAVVSFVLRSRPASVAQTATGEKGGLRRIVIGFLVAGAVVGGCLSWFASARPDGLEWALGKTSGNVEFAAPRDGLHRALAKIGQKTALLADYGFREGAGVVQPAATRCGTSVSGLVGGLITLALAGLIGYGVKRRKI